MRPGRGALLAALGLAAACSASVTSERLGADAAVDAQTDAQTDAAPVACRWSAPDFSRIALVSDPADQERFRLLDAVATPDGALVAWRERSPAGDRDRVRVRRIREDGTGHPWSTAGRGSGGEVVALDPGGALQFSMVWDAARDGVAMLAGGATDRGACVFARFLGDDSQQWQAVDLDALMGFPLSGCGALARTGGGYSFLTGEVRALWGDQLVFLSDDGRVAGRPARLAMTGAPTERPMTRGAATGGFVATWTEAGLGGMRGQVELHARRFDAAGATRGDDQVLQRGAGAVTDAQVLETRDGLLATWHTARDAEGMVAARALGPDAAPVGEAVTFPQVPSIAGVHAAVRGSQVLVAAPTPVTFGTRIYLLVLDGRGAPTQAPLELLMNQQAFTVGPMRVVPTARGALILFETANGFGDAGQAGGRILALPVDCLPSAG